MTPTASVFALRGRRSIAASDASIAAFARSRSARTCHCGQHDLGAVMDSPTAVTEHLVRIMRAGIAAALDTHLTEPASTDQ